MGRVFLGRSAGGRPVAVKVVRSELAADPDFRVRFRREVAAAQKVSGLFTAVVVDADTDAVEPWLATAYVAGPSLAEAVRDHGPLPVGSVLALAAGLAESLAAIHAAGVVHRDLKPSNVLLAEDGPRVIDFGISRAAEATSMTRAGFVIGSPGFMSPEQAEGGEVGPASDIFSLGAVLVFAATGESPFGSGLTAALIYRVVHTPARLAGVPDEILPLVERCLAKDPGRRPTVGDLLAEVGAVQSMTGWLPEPIISAFPDGPAQAAAEPSPPPLAAEPSPPAVGKPSAASPDTGPTITGHTALVAPGPEAAPRQAGTQETEAVTSQPETVPPESEAMSPEPETISPESGTVTSQPGTVTSQPGTITTEPGAIPLALEPATPAPGPGPGPATLAPGPGPGPATLAPGAGPEPVAPELGPGPGPGAEPEAVVLPRPDADLRHRQRRRLSRPLVLGSAAAVILIGSITTALALSGSGHASAPPSPGGTVAAETTPLATVSTQLTSPRPSPSASVTGQRSSGSPSTKPTTPHATAQAPTTGPGSAGPTPATSSPAPRPTTTPKPQPKPTPPPTYGFSVSGAGEFSCGDEGSVRSSDGASVEFGFADHSSSDVQLALIDTSGALEWEATVVPGAVFQVSAYVGNYWVVENSGGGCLAVFEIDGGGQVTVT